MMSARFMTPFPTLAGSSSTAIPALLSVHFDYDDLMGIVREVVRVRDELKQYSVAVDCSELAERFFLNQRCGDVLEV